MNIHLQNQIAHAIGQNPDMFDDLLPSGRKAFRKWLVDNTHVVEAFIKYARQLKHQGNREYYSAYCIRERIRWDSMITQIGGDYKISNNITPFVARLVMKLDPSLKGMFRTKNVTGA